MREKRMTPREQFEEILDHMLDELVEKEPSTRDMIIKQLDHAETTVLGFAVIRRLCREYDEAKQRLVAVEDVLKGVTERREQEEKEDGCKRVHTA